jgi:transposase
MFFPEGQIRVHLYGQPVDMRKSFDGLVALTQYGLGEDPLSGALFVFINRRATQMKVLYFDRSGFCVWAKRLEAGRFLSDWNEVRTQQMDWTGLKLLLEGIETVRQRKRYRHAMHESSAALRATTVEDSSGNFPRCP